MIFLIKKLFQKSTLRILEKFKGEKLQLGKIWKFGFFFVFWHPYNFLPFFLSQKIGVYFSKIIFWVKKWCILEENEVSEKQVCSFFNKIEGKGGYKHIRNFFDHSLRGQSCTC